MRIDRVRDWPGLAQALYGLEKAGFAHPWTLGALQAALRADWNRTYLFWFKGQVVGYALIQVVMDEGEVLRFMVLPDHQGQGLGSAALDLLLAQLEGEGIDRIFLEVRKDNRPAQGLYAKHGFEPVGKRRHYYEDGEDAYLFTRERRDR